MSTHDTPRVAVIGLGEAGRGWATLAAAAGWTVAVYESDPQLLQSAVEEIEARVQRLVSLGLSERELAANALTGLRVGRSLLHVVGDAEWIVEAGRDEQDELAPRQRTLEHIEQVARLAAVTTSSSGRHHASALCARLRRPQRFLVVHPLQPVELQPLVEVVPGPATESAAVDDVHYWLGALRRQPIVLRKEVPGNAIGRISAAVWRECIQLVLDGVLPVEEVDRLVALGPAAGWAAGGPHLTQHLAAGTRPAVGLSASLTEHEAWWTALATWQRLEQEDQARLVKAIERAYGDHGAEARLRRDERLLRILGSVEPPR